MERILSIKINSPLARLRREYDDCSFDTLERYYSAQTTDYQNTSIRIGFLLVLDQTEIRIEGTLHITTLIKPCTIIRKTEIESCLVVIVKVPGRRLRPSDLTKVVKGNW